MSDRVEAAAKAIADWDVDPASSKNDMGEWATAMAEAAVAAADRVSLAGTEEVLSQLAFKLQAIFKNNPRNIVEAKAAIAAALAGLAGENARLKTALQDVVDDSALNAVAGWYDCLKRARAALQEPPDEN